MHQRPRTELTGMLPVAADLGALSDACPAVGEAKEAAQQGRRIATLKRGAVRGLTGTFAFLSDGEDELF